MRSIRIVVAATCALALAGAHAARAAATAGSATTVYELEPLAAATVLVEVPDPPPLHEMRFVLGGNNQAIVIDRITGQPNADPDIQFTEASPREVTVYFAQNTMPVVGSNVFHIYARNLDTRPQKLVVHASWSDAP